VSPSLTTLRPSNGSTSLEGFSYIGDVLRGTIRDRVQSAPAYAVENQSNNRMLSTSNAGAVEGVITARVGAHGGYSPRVVDVEL
jgi:hypothetical protein